MDSVLNVNKHVGPTSFGIVKQVREILGGLKIGHAGSLDPFATGVLILLVGRATKWSDLLLNADKVYQGKVVLGRSTDTYDRDGQVVEEAPVPTLTEESVRSVMRSFLGEWQQQAPPYSAKKIHGVRSYELARQNIWVKREPQPVQIKRLDLIGFTDKDISFEVECSKGTYVRSLAEEMARRLGTVGFLDELCRTQCGKIHLSDSLTVDEIAKDPQTALKQGVGRLARLGSSYQSSQSSKKYLQNEHPGDRRVFH